MDLLLAAAYLKLGRMGRIPREELPDMAVRAVLAGMVSPALSILAGETDPHWSEGNALLERALAELGLTFPTRQAAIIYVVTRCAEEISDRSAPLEQITQEAANVLDVGPEIPREFRPFVAVVRNYADYGKDMSRLCQEAERLVDTTKAPSG